MPLIEETLFGREDKVQKAIERLQTFEPPEGYYLAFSGGKDSQCIYHLAKMAGVKFDAHYSVTSIDPPELMRFIRDNYPEVEWERHYYKDEKAEHYFPDGRPKPITMWTLIADHTIPPTRQARYCCSQLKETGGTGRLVVTGVRWAESSRRKQLHGVANIQTKSKKLHDEAAEIESYKINSRGGIIFLDDNDDNRKLIEQCYLKNRTTINPIIDWTEDDVWEFLNDVAKVPHCSLYDEGFTRLGCIGCPLQGTEGMLRDFERWPRYKQLYIRAFDRMIQLHPSEIRVVNEFVEDPVNLSMSTEDGVEEKKNQIRGTYQSASRIGECGVRSGLWSDGSPHNDGDGIPDVLAMAVSPRPERLEQSSFWENGSKENRIREYNHDPRVADYESAEYLFDWWVF